MWRDRHDLTMSGGDLAFEKLYESIYYCNVVIENIGEADGVELNEENVERTRKNIEGEARCLRAYSYFYLVNLYAMAYDPATCATDPEFLSIIVRRWKTRLIRATQWLRYTNRLFPI